jgi:hypothetical protein
MFRKKTENKGWQKNGKKTNMNWLEVEEGETEQNDHFETEKRENFFKRTDLTDLDLTADQTPLTNQKSLCMLTPVQV